MSEVTDIILPILPKIQSDIGELRRKVDGVEKLVESMKGSYGHDRRLLTRLV